MNFDGCCGVAQALRATVVRWVLAVLCVAGACTKLGAGRPALQGMEPVCMHAITRVNRCDMHRFGLVRLALRGRMG